VNEKDNEKQGERKRRRGQRKGMYLTPSEMNFSSLLKRSWSRFTKKHFSLTETSLCNHSEKAKPEKVKYE